MFKANVTLEFPGGEGDNMFEFGGGQGADKKIYNAALTCETALGNTTNRDNWFTVNLGSNLKVGGYTEDGKRILGLGSRN